MGSPCTEELRGRKTTRERCLRVLGSGVKCLELGDVAFELQQDAVYQRLLPRAQLRPSRLHSRVSELSSLPQILQQYHFRFESREAQRASTARCSRRARWQQLYSQPRQPCRTRCTPPISILRTMIFYSWVEEVVKVAVGWRIRLYVIWCQTPNVRLTELNGIAPVRPSSIHRRPPFFARSPTYNCQEMKTPLLR